MLFNPQPQYICTPFITYFVNLTYLKWAYHFVLYIIQTYSKIIIFLIKRYCSNSCYLKFSLHFILFQLPTNVLDNIIKIFVLTPVCVRLLYFCLASVVTNDNERQRNYVSTFQGKYLRRAVFLAVLSNLGESPMKCKIRPGTTRRSMKTLFPEKKTPIKYTINHIYLRLYR